MKVINWHTNREEHNLIVAIAERAVEIAQKVGIEYDQRTAVMDITATHANGCPLQLRELLAAPNGDFTHDVFGIRRHINRETGKLDDFFLPRYAQPANKVFKNLT